jgi:hypothetical protein
MSRQTARLRACLANAQPWHSLLSEFPELADVTHLTTEEVVRLYRAYVGEWDMQRALPAGVARRTGRTVAL